MLKQSHVHSMLARNAKEITLLAWLVLQSKITLKDLPTFFEKSNYIKGIISRQKQIKKLAEIQKALKSIKFDKE